MAKEKENKVGRRELKKQKDNIEKMEEKIKESKKIDKDYTKKMYGKIFENSIIAVFIMAFFYCMNLGVVNIETQVFALDIKVLSLIALGITIILFEVAYKKDNDTIAIHGIEMLVIAIIIGLLFIPFKKYDLDYFRKILTMCTTLTGLYYLFKSLIISVQMKNKYFKDKNDISEIVKK